MPLTFAKMGEKMIIRKISGKDDLRRHLGNLGFIEGESVTVVCENNGNYILNVKDSRVALNKEIASRIMV